MRINKTESALGSSPVAIFAPGGFLSGGPELSHQLADALNRRGVVAKMIYVPIGKKFEVPDSYSKYAVEAARLTEMPDGATVIIPEVYTAYLPRLSRFRVIVWWMSVDNYFSSGHWRFALVNGMWPWSFHDIRKRPFPPNVISHFVQSEYARAFLAANGVKSVDYLSDYLNEEYTRRINLTQEDGTRRNIVVYNPQKGLEQTRKILERLNPEVAVPIRNLDREEVVALLSCAKVYIDFGNHPGKDRIPREAAALGCCVITNLRGSAANRLDVPIDARYKIDDTLADFADMTVELIEDIFRDFSAHNAAFESYRAVIAAERRRFLEDIDRIFLPTL